MNYLLFLLLLICLTTPAKAQLSYQANWESLKKNQTPEWFKDAKFDIFIHWGVYSMSAFTNT